MPPTCRQECWNYRCVYYTWLLTWVLGIKFRPPGLHNTQTLLNSESAPQPSQVISNLFLIFLKFKTCNFIFCVRVSDHVHRWTRVRRSKVNLGCHPLGASYIVFEIRCLSPGHLGKRIRLGWLGSKPQGPQPHLYLLGSGLQVCTLT